MTRALLQKAADGLVLALRRVTPADAVVGLALVFAAIQAARLFWVLVTPIAPIGDWRPSAVNVVPASERGALFGGFDPFFRTEQVSADTEVVTSLPLTLFGIRTNEASGGGSAIIAGADGVQNSWSVGETIMPGATLHSVAFDHVVISNNGVLEKMYIDQSVPAENVTPNSIEPTPEPTSEPAVKLNAQTLQQSVGLNPRNEGGKVTGLVVSAKDDGTMISAAGLQKGDVITSVNGRPVSAAAELAAQLRPGARLTLEIERGAQKLPVALILEQ
ncbi:PDZ domain-containing protein [Sphingorhabdus pulchriflava]|uniref:PDZ domain-containing protein n=1 Tax=Sphingorhabdus pulchriflava TaxID=2292257 RepID=A0A371BFI5_9SPHN|nr:type II secretion system protein N [Sphingorhabdus pulchriflava]RDV06330.1 PDZ domain-containing protein [Sphingorhabdus pulchriflava]